MLNFYYRMEECYSVNGKPQPHDGLVVLDIVDNDVAACINVMNELKCKTLIITVNSKIIKNQLSNVTIFKVKFIFLNRCFLFTDNFFFVEANRI